MVHVTCDFCGKELSQGEDQRYVVKIEITAAGDPSQITEADLDDDHMEAISQVLRDELEELTNADLEEAGHQRIRYDLCSGCRERFARDPLNREVDRSFDFSEN